LKDRQDFVFKKNDEEKYFIVKIKKVAADNIITVVISDITRLKSLE